MWDEATSVASGFDVATSDAASVIAEATSYAASEYVVVTSKIVTYLDGATSTIDSLYTEVHSLSSFPSFRRR